MKRIKLLVIGIGLLTCSLPQKTTAQSAEAEQLLLNWEKLTQLKAVLQNLYDGYKILEKGYGAVKDLSEGNFSLHKTFLDGLLEVSPAVKNYKRVADIISYQVRMVKESRAARARFSGDKAFTLEEIKYLEQVYSRLLQGSLEHLDELALILTAGELRMSDEERLQAIDRIYAGVMDQYAFLRHFTSRTGLLAGQRTHEKAEVVLLEKLNGF